MTAPRDAKRSHGNAFGVWRRLRCRLGRHTIEIRDGLVYCPTCLKPIDTIGPRW